MAVGAGLIAASALTATIATVGAIAGAVAAGLSLAASVSARGAAAGTVGGNPTKFKVDKDAGIPIVFGRTLVGGNVIHRQYYGTKNSLESWVTALSLGPVKSVGPLQIDKADVTFVGGQAQGSYNGFMWLDTQLGACPEPDALIGPVGGIPGWDANSKLSGIAADLWTLRFDAKVYPNGVPQRGRVVEGVFAWDPRLDSTVPGGSGPCRLNDPSTHIWTENPWLLGLQFALGFLQNGRLVAGGGLPLNGVDLVRVMEAANYADLVGWRAGGLVYTTADNDWEILQMLAQAGAGEWIPVGGLLSCTFSSPKVSIGTVRSEDLMGDADIPSTASMRNRRNTVIPRVRLESHGWEVVPIDAISVPEYITEDGGVRPREVDLPLVQDVDLGAKIGVLKMLDDRELDGIVLPLKVYALGYLPGDALDVDIPEGNLTGRQIVVRNREIEASSLGVTLTCRSETPGKHAFALGRTGSPPPTPDLSVPPSYPVGSPEAAAILIQNSAPLEQAFITSVDTGGGTASITIAAHTRRYADKDVAVAGATLTARANATYYDIYYDDADRTGGAVTYTTTQDPPSARLSADHPGRHYVGFITTAAAGGAGTGGGGATPPGGGYCVTTDTLILMADGTEKRAGDLRRGDRVRTRHEHTLLWGDFTVSAVSIVREPILHAAGYPDATAEHRFWTEADGWFAMSRIGKPAGWAEVVRITVPGAATYVSRHPSAAEAVLSHNIKQLDPET